MPDIQATGKYLIIIGILVVIAGGLVYFFGDKLHWLGRLPGDIRIERDNFRFFFPITTMLLLSGLLNLVIWLVRRFLS
jgi:H+/Cl- antiporter ClcA